MITSSFTGHLIHISRDGQRTNCGRDCSTPNWEPIEWAKDGHVSWEATLSDCPRCGTAAVFAKERTELARRWEAHMLEIEKRRAAMQNLCAKWQALIEEQCPGVSTQHYYSTTAFVTTVVEDGLEFEVKAVVNLGWPLR